MSKDALRHLRDFIVGTLPADDVRWLVMQLNEQYPIEAEEQLRPYTMEEINQMIDEAERDIAEGRVYTFEEVTRDLKEKDEQPMLEAV